MRIPRVQQHGTDAQPAESSLRRITVGEAPGQRPGATDELRRWRVALASVMHDHETTIGSAEIGGACTQREDLPLETLDADE